MIWLGFLQSKAVRFVLGVLLASGVSWALFIQYGVWVKTQALDKVAAENVNNRLEELQRVGKERERLSVVSDCDKLSVVYGRDVCTEGQSSFGDDLERTKTAEEKKPVRTRSNNPFEHRGEVRTGSFFRVEVEQGVCGAGQIEIIEAGESACVNLEE